MFIDKVNIYVKAGDGGDGAISFHREKYVANGGPDGGDGGKGGDIIIKTSDNLSTLVDFRYKKKFKAQNGENGKGGNKYGKGGADLIIKVPRGTLIKDEKSGKVIIDLSNEDSFTVAKGGKGGVGNTHFKSSKRQAPRFAKPGQRGEELNLTLELKMLADVGVIGFPNVGKSTLISVVSSARPKIGNYHFTTLNPILGVVKGYDDDSFVMVDIPGLIEGAGEGAGLGYRFLRHVERCRMLVHLLDGSQSEGRDPKEDYKKINKELVKFNEELADIPQILVANKKDIMDKEQIESLKEFAKSVDKKIFFISAATKEGVDELMNEIKKVLPTLPPIKLYKTEYVKEEKIDNDNFDIELKGGIYYIKGNFIDNLLRGTNINDYQSLSYMYEVLKKKGVVKELENMDIKEGDTVDLEGYQFEYIK